jgi:hypothetical protein
VIAHVISYAVFVCGFVQAETCYLIEVFTLFVHNNRHVLLLKTVARKQLHQILLTECFEGTPVILAVARLCQIDGFVAIPWPIVISLSLRAVRMADVVSIVLFEFVGVDVVFLCELLLPISEGLVHSQTDSLQEQAQL